MKLNLRTEEIQSHLFVSFQNINTYICDALRDFIPFVQFKKREKQPWWSVAFRKVAG